MTRPRRYVKTWLDRVGPDNAVVLIRGLPWAIAGGGTIGALAGGRLFGVIGALVGFVLGSAVVFVAMTAVVNIVAWLVRRSLEPSGASTPYQFEWSHIESHVVRGEFDAAAILYEEAVAGPVADVEVRVRAADFFAGPIGRPARALELFQAVQCDPAAKPERQLYASQRVVDLLLGPLADKGRAVVELRRIVDRWPNSHAARFGRDALRRLKAELHGDAAG